jgi:hypothetical protein
VTPLRLETLTGPIGGALICIQTTGKGRFIIPYLKQLLKHEGCGKQNQPVPKMVVFEIVLESMKNRQPKSKRAKQKTRTKKLSVMLPPGTYTKEELRIILKGLQNNANN